MAQNDFLEKAIDEYYKNNTDIFKTRENFGKMIYRFIDLYKSELMKDSLIGEYKRIAKYGGCIYVSGLSLENMYDEDSVNVLIVKK